jgi:DNA topoisomerase-2
VRITELPVGTWTDDYKKYIEELIDTKVDAPALEKKSKPANQVKDYKDMSTDTTVDITLTFATGVIAALKDTIIEHDSCTALEKLLKLYTTRSITNMHVFDENEKLVKFEKVEDLIAMYMDVRLAYYQKRKAQQVIQLDNDAKILSSKARFITELLEDTLDLRKKKTAEVSAILKAKKYAVIDDDVDYKYLVRLPMDSVTEENIKKIINERDQKLKELDTLKATTEKQIWLNELAILRAEYLKVLARTTTAPPSVIKPKIIKKKL